ncbi:hypothetical protein GRAN_4337 [Granulicella sibirica]|uniref:LUD domain-containing protein n=1 Tax=Granulicella sibirica TaxID=2479048 RepID=A0A4Q0SVZ8_9BACT|nr:hypothetical protein GRAN_4337 [Granulicella sibirica]
MNASTASRELMLGRIRTANAAAGAGAGNAAEEWAAIPREYRRTSTLGREAVLELLEDRLRDYDAHVLRVASEGVAAAVLGMLGERGRTRMLAAPGVTAAWLPEGFAFAVDDGLSVESIDRFEGVMTESTLAIAETGTIVLQTVPGQGRRAVSLVPDYHLCLVRASAVVATVPEAMDVLATRPAFATTFISGPSATADIEMTRIKGVHGPRFLDVLLVMDDVARSA